MKRRKTVNKYRVDKMGQITNTQPTLSPKTRKLMEFVTMMSAFSDAFGGNGVPQTDDVEKEAEEETGENNDTIDI